MTRIGLVDLDTSHPKSFTKILNAMPGVKVNALWDGRDVWPEGYDERFAKENDIPNVCKRLEDMIEHVDAVMIHGVNWDKHVDRAYPFIEAGKPVLIDKPMVGKVRDIYTLLELHVTHGTPVYGGSALRYAQEIGMIRSQADRVGEVLTAIATGPGDFFSYGIHTTELAQGMVGTGANYVEYVAENKSSFIAVTYHNGFVLLLQLQQPFQEWSMCLYSTTGMHTMRVDPTRMYEAFLQNFIDIVNKKDVSFSLEAPLEAVKILIAAKLSRQHGGKIYLSEVPAEEGFDGAAYAAEYAAAKRRGV
ncbi:MAG: Gfo/Idh/MocA family oxidoreductase [Bacteroidota bacterium]|jgi:predicted dehydrogenase